VKKDTDLDIDLYHGLQALSDLSFPKQCATCGNRFETAEAFISQTESIRKSSGLKEDVDDEDRVIVELFRNCPCGSTLMDEFNNRRDLSETGIKRREKFGELLDRLTHKGFSMKTAREELLKVMRGEGSKLLKIKKNPVAKKRS
jgi:hypothetical protein